MISLINVPCDSPAEYYQSAPKAAHALTRNIRPRLKSSLSSPQLTRTQREGARRMRKSFSFNRARGITAGAIKQYNVGSQEWLNIFGKRRTFKQINYLRDGRKTLNGKIAENSSMPSTKLWEDLLLRSLAHKMEGEIESPVRENAEFPPIDGQVSRVGVKNAAWRLRSHCTMTVLSKMLQNLQKDATIVGRHLRCLPKRFNFSASYSPITAERALI